MKEFNSDNSKKEVEESISRDENMGDNKPYSKPVLIEHGNVSEMIQGVAGGTVDAFIGGTAT